MCLQIYPVKVPNMSFKQTPQVYLNVEIHERYYTNAFTEDIRIHWVDAVWVPVCVSEGVAALAPPSHHLLASQGPFPT